MLDSILLHSSGLKKGNYSKFILTLSPVDKASVVPGVSCSILSDRLVCTKAGMGNCLGWEGTHRWTRLQHTETVPQLRVCVCTGSSCVWVCTYKTGGLCVCRFVGSSAKACLETPVRPSRPAGTEASHCTDCQSSSLGLGKVGYWTVNSTSSVPRRLGSHGLQSMSARGSAGCLGKLFSWRHFGFHLLQLWFTSSSCSELEVSAHPEAQEFVFLVKLLIIAVVTLVGLLLICELFTRSRKGKMCWMSFSWLMVLSGFIAGEDAVVRVVFYILADI